MAEMDRPKEHLPDPVTKKVTTDYAILFSMYMSVMFFVKPLWVIRKVEEARKMKKAGK